MQFVDAARARCVLVVEKDSVFRRLVDDHFTRRLPSVVVTASGFPDLATRALVARLVDALNVPAFCLTDWNPYGLALMLTYKLGSVRMGLERHCCPTLQWLGLHSTDVGGGGVGAVGGGAGVNDADRMPFSVRDRQVLGGLMRRSEVLQDEALMREARAMDAVQQKVEIEALHGGFGMDALGDFLVAKIVDRAAL